MNSDRVEGESDNEWAERLHREQQAERRRVLTEAKKAALEAGKEPFDLEKLWELWDFSPQLASPDWKPTAETIEALEEKYFVRYPEFRTLEEFAKLMNELDPYR